MLHGNVMLHCGSLRESWMNIGQPGTELRRRGRRVLLVGVVCNPLLSWCPALVWQACAPGRRTVSAWGDTARHSQTDGRSGCQAAVCASRRAAHSGRTAWQTRALDSAACAQHSAVVRDSRQLCARLGSCAHGLGSGRQLCARTRQRSAAVRWNSAVVESTRQQGLGLGSCAPALGRLRSRKLSPKQARWQEFLGEFDFEWVHRPGKHNDVADALSRKLVEEYIAALTVVESDFLDQIRESSKTDASYLKLVEQVKSGLIRKYWLDSGLLYAKVDECLCQRDGAPPFAEGGRLDGPMQTIGCPLG
ncbi:hypothetical protein Sango_2926100 [Sesamum angolense]|uniref:Uncharacterized protein n=1 Tax=Sesamum angolense TaxID=2727404 RepID=A0AAE1T634_9LAMI|nr:hypothetical protein Sango_2926100 [Sesamum angolense]